MAMTIHEFARAVGVSTATVWRAVNDRPGISEPTRMKILRKMEELGYRPNQAARALVTGKSNMISLWMPSIDQPYDVLVLRHMQEQVVSHDFEMVIRDVSYIPGHEQRFADFRQWPVDGIVVLDGTDHGHGTLQERLRGAVPTVSIGAYCNRAFDHVGIDLGYGAARAVEHLVAQGRKRIAYVVPEYFFDEGDPRREGYLQGVHRAGQDPIVIKTRGASWRFAADAVGACISEQGCPDGFFCFNDVHAIGVYRALRAAGLSVPADAAVIGCDGIEEGAMIEQPITTVVAPVPEMCARAWEYLSARMADETLPRQGTMLSPELLIRQTA